MMKLFNRFKLLLVSFLFRDSKIIKLVNTRELKVGDKVLFSPNLIGVHFIEDIGEIVVLYHGYVIGQIKNSYRTYDFNIPTDKKIYIVL